MKKKNYRSLSDQYRKKGKGFLSSEEASAYALARMPATQAAISAVFKELKLRYSGNVERFLDLGAGTGAGVLAAREAFSTISEALLVESNPHMRKEGESRVEAQWVGADLFHVDFPESDCALFGYSYGELHPQKRLSILEKVFDKSQLIVVVEPGTPRGYENVLEARNHLLSKGGRMVAPCPHEIGCPMVGGDWCHFSVRVSRTKEHRQLKEAHLGYEDEKFSYVVVAKEGATPAEGRILRHPLKQKGHVKLRICTDEGIVETTVSKKQGDDYREARKVCWGGGTSLHRSKPH